MNAAPAIRLFLVTVATPKGRFDVELRSQSPEAASRRAFFTMAASRYGDLDEITVESVEEIEDHD